MESVASISVPPAVPSLLLHYLLQSAYPIKTIDLRMLT